MNVYELYTSQLQQCFFAWIILIFHLLKCIFKISLSKIKFAVSYYLLKWTFVFKFVVKSLLFSINNTEWHMEKCRSSVLGVFSRVKMHMRKYGLVPHLFNFIHHLSLKVKKFFSVIFWLFIAIVMFFTNLHYLIFCV